MLIIYNMKLINNKLLIKIIKNQAKVLLYYKKIKKLNKMDYLMYYYKIIWEKN